MDKIVGEEDSSELLTKENEVVRNQIVRLSNEAMLETLNDGEAEWSQVKQDCATWQEKEWLAVIDRGNSAGGPSGRTYFVGPS